jgi:hypothetical protein
MAGGSIAEPGVEVIQQFVAPAPSIITPILQTVIAGTVFQIIDAFADDGSPQSEALTGIYRDGFGVISYDLPGLLATSTVAGFEDDVRVFLTYGAEVRELNPESGEQSITSATGSGDLTFATLTFADATALFNEAGVEAGDALRISFRGATLDLIVVSVESETSLTLSSVGIIDENLSSIDYAIVRNPTEFVFAATTQASTIIGSEADYLSFSVLASSVYAGSLGDALSLLVTDSVHYYEGTDGAAGDSIFAAASGTFLSTVGARGVLTGTNYYISVGAAAASPFTDGEVLRQVFAVVSNTGLFIETGETVLASQNWLVGSEHSTGSTPTLVGPVLTFTGTTFDTTGATDEIPTTGVLPQPPDTDTYIELELQGVYKVLTVDSDTQLTLSATPAAAPVGPYDYTIIEMTQDGTAGADGDTAAANQFAAISVDLTLAGITGKYINVGGTEADTIASQDTADQITLTGAGLGPGALLTYSVVDAAAPLALSYDADNALITIQLERALGVVDVTTLADVNTAITSIAAPAYNAAVSAIVVSVLSSTGALVIDATDLDILQAFDGGADEGQLTIDADLLGSPVPTAQVYVSYQALRTDVTGADDDFINLLEFSTEADVAARIGPIDIRNPLALACSRALQNSPSRPIKAIGVSAVSTSKPFGTSAAFSECFSYLESNEVYTIVPLTQDPEVHVLLNTHITSMSTAASKSERIGFFSQQLPAYSQAAVIGSGVDGNNGTGVIVGNAAGEFQASTDFAAAGVQTAIDAGKTLVLVVTALSTSADASDAANGTVGPLYGIPVVGVKTGDNFTLTVNGTGTVAGGGALPAGWDTLIDVSFTVYDVGVAITQASDQAEAVANISESFADRRMFHHWPDRYTTSVDSTEQIVDGFYLAAGWAGVVNQVPPEQGLTRFAVAGATGLLHSGGYFSRANLDRIAGGGTFISVQDVQGGAVRCRHQLSTDVSSIQKRELSITKVVDYTAKYLRLSLNKHVGKFNITQTYLDALSTTIQGVLASLIESGKLVDARLIELGIDDLQPDTINVTIAIDVPFPANYIVVTLEI